MIKKAILAPILIGLGVVVNLILGQPLGPIFFSFGLLGVCYLEAELFTGKAGYMWRNKKFELSIILIINLIVGWAFGQIIGIMNPGLILPATKVVSHFSWSLPYFIESLLCGMVMYVCVSLYKKKTNLGIMLGVPLFIYCGFQHSIANIIYLGLANSFSSAIILCIFGNFLGSVIMNILEEV